MIQKLNIPFTGFPLGRLLATPGALRKFDENATHVFEVLILHRRGDWGTVSPEDWKLNDDAVHQGTRIFSAYTLKDGTKVWVITEADRSSTTVLLPEEY